MFKNYFKITIRNLFRNKLFTFINICGLAIGLASCLMIYLWVQDELSYDRFHQNAERIYRVERKVDFRDIHGQAPITSGAYGPALVRDYAEVENFARLDRNELSIKNHRNTYHRQNLLFTDNSLFEVFDFRLEEGDTKTVLTEPRSVVLTREMAVKYFGTDDVLGRSLTVDWNEQMTDFKVTGILEEVPQNSHVQFDMAASISTYSDEIMSGWFNNFIHTYVLLKEGASAVGLEKKLPDFLTKYLAKGFAAILGPDADVNDVFQLKMNPLLDIHLHPAEQFEIEPQGSQTSVTIFSMIALLILVIACINFMNLSTARANKRAKEVGIRKTIGAYKHQLWRQFLSESVILSFFALVLAVLLIKIFLPFFNTIAGKNLSAGILFSPKNVLILVGITLLTGLCAGLYPAFYITAFEPSKVLKGSALSGTKKSGFRTSMAVLQFVISITLIIGTLIIFKQMKYIQNKSLGFDKENIVLIPTESQAVRQNLNVFRNSLTDDTRVLSVAGSSNVPGSALYSDTVFKREGSDDIYNLIYMTTDYDFVVTYKFKVIHGRSFSKEYGSDIQGAYLINEAAAREMDYKPEEAVGKKIYRATSPEDFSEGTIVGVVDNFHFKSLHRIIEPLTLVLDPDRVGFISVRIRPGDVRGTLDFIRQKWMETFPDENFEYRFLDDRINLLYANESNMRTIVLVFAALSILVACLGLFGLAAFAAQQRTKEMGVRKVLGASELHVFVLLCKEFTKWVIAANIIAWPLAYYMMTKWLQNFAYRMTVGIWPFVLSAVAAFFIAFFTVSYQSVKAALAEPVDSLRYE
ncbi:MAG: ABC transporter permease [Candidatus Aminicenantes bacterium]|nr:ABC transporter permease [Candidatus Aminicenantes bacterium]